MTEFGRIATASGLVTFPRWRCQNTRSLQYISCLNDENIELDDDGYYVIAISGPSERPANATNWMHWGPIPEGVLIYRQILPSEEFYPMSLRYVSDHPDEDLKEVAGPYLPVVVHCTKAEFEENRRGL